MLRFFLGLTLVQTAVATVTYFNPAQGFVEKFLPLGFLILLLSTVGSLWFSAVAKQSADKRVNSLQQKFAAEREKINKNAERDKDKLVRKTNKQIEVEARRTKVAANLKVGGAIALAGGFGVVMLLSQFVTLGLLTLTTAGGAVGGYLVRSRREQEALESSDYKMIDAQVVEDGEVQALPDHTSSDDANSNNNDEKAG